MINQNNIILKYLLMTLLTMMTSMYFIETKLPMYDVIILGLTVSIIYALLDRVLPSINSNNKD
jgi:hypothetical protein